MSRCDQYIGLNSWARRLIHQPKLSYRDFTTRVYDNGEVETLEVKCGYKQLSISEPSGETFGGFEGDYELKKHTMPDGRVYKEFLQASPWSSGPMFFIALKLDGEIVKESLWTDEEMRDD